MKRKIIPYNPKLKELARQLRKNMTLSEVLLQADRREEKLDRREIWLGKEWVRYEPDQRPGLKTPVNCDLPPSS